MRRLGSLRVLVATALLGAALAGCSIPGRGGGGTYHLTALFDSAVGLYPHGDVSVMGVAVGTVDEVEIDVDHIRVEMSIRDDVPLPADVQATIEPLTLIGERNVVLFPPWDEAMAARDAPRAGDGDVVPLDRTEVPVEPDEALEAFNELARSLDPDVVGDLVTDSAEALEGLGDDLGTAIDNAAGITSTLAEVDENLVASADALHRLAVTLGTREAQLGGLVRSFSDATQVLSDEREGLRRFLGSLVTITEQGQGILDTYGQQLPQDIARLARLAMVFDQNSAATERLIASFPEVAEGIANGYQPEIGGIFLRANMTPTLVALFGVLRELLGVLGIGGVL